MATHRAKRDIINWMTTPRLSNALAMLLLASLPMFSGPGWLKSTFARVARSTKGVPSWHWTELEGTSLYLGTVPTSDEQLQELRDEGVRAVVSLNQRWEPQAPQGVRAACVRQGLSHLSIPTPDYSAPSLETIQKACDFIRHHVGGGSRVYIHCNAGRGRSAVCVLAFLMESRGLSAHAAYELVAAQRRITPLPTRLLGLPRPQWRVLQRFEKKLQAAREQQLQAGRGQATSALGPVATYSPGPPNAALAPPGQCVFSEEWLAAPLTARVVVSHDTLLLSFGLPDPTRPLGLSTCACLLARASIGGDSTAAPVVRPFTPVSTNALLGTFQLLVKVYEDGAMSSHLASLPIGVSVEFRHMQANVKRQYPFGARQLVLIAGGTGITPMLQALQALLGTADDATEVTLLYSSKTEADIIARSALDVWAATHRSRFRVTYTLTREPTGSAWKRNRGRIDASFLAAHVPPPSQAGVLLFVCGPPGMYEDLSGPRAEPELSGALAKLGYSAEQVVKL